MIAAIWHRLRDGVARFVHEPDWTTFVGNDWTARIMDVPVRDRFHAKQGRSIGRWRLNADGQWLVVYLKRHYRLSRWAGLLAMLFPSRAWSPGLREWHHLKTASALGLPTPRAVAAGQWAGPWGRLRSFIAIEELAGMLPLHEAVPLAAHRLAPAAFARWKRGLIRELARNVRLLHDRGWFHNDLYMCHFYIPEALTYAAPEQWQNRVSVIDFHRFGRAHGGMFYSRVKDLGQLLYSSQVEGVTNRDRRLFWLLYRGRRRQSLLRRAIEFKAGRYRRHNARRKANRTRGVAA
ncbi:MAG: lipopolysaccharide kinase InaA family protein [Gemmataceae bacterium]